MLKYKINIRDIIEKSGNVQIQINETLTPILGQEELILDNIKTNDVNQTLDYEKIKCEPIYIINEFQVSLLSSMLFYPNFYINNDWSSNGTKLKLLGITEDDVKNRRNRLSKSFLRLSFYDNDNLTTQNLLYYSNIFVDSGRIYGEYISGANFDDLILKFNVENPKFGNNNNKYEGFNIYLFKDDIQKNETKTIYLKIEYNNAINGSTSLFLKNKPVDTNGYTLNEVKNNMFLAISVKYDMELKKYVYWINGNANNKNMVINLYQAKVK